MIFRYGIEYYNLNEENGKVTLIENNQYGSDLNFNNAYICVLREGMAYIEGVSSLIDVEREDIGSLFYPMYGVALPFGDKFYFVEEDVFGNPNVYRFDIKERERKLKIAEENKKKRDLLEEYIRLFLIFRHPASVYVYIPYQFKRFIEVETYNSISRTIFYFHDGLQAMNFNIVFDDNFYPISDKINKYLVEAHKEDRIIEIK